MRKSVQLVGLLIAIAGVAIGIGVAQAQGQSNTTATQSNIKPIPTFPTVSVVHKQTTPTSDVTSCPISTLPQPGIVKIAPPNSDPTYKFESMAIGVSGGQPYYILGGYVRATPTQGIILVQPISLDPCKDFVTQIAQPASQSSATASVAVPVWSTPSQDGGITLTGVIGNTVSYTT